MSLDIRIGLGDCLDLMDRIGEGTVDLVLTDLPYGVTKCDWDVAIPFKHLWEHFERVVKPEGLVVLFGTEPFSSICRVSNIKRYRYDWIWRKSRATGFLDAGSRPLKDYENIMVFYSSDLIRDTTNFFPKSKSYLIGEKRKAEVAGFRMRDVLGNYMGNHYFVTKKQFTFPSEEDYKKLQATGYFQRDYNEVLQEYKSEKKKVSYNPQFDKERNILQKVGELLIYIMRREYPVFRTERGTLSRFWSLTMMEGDTILRRSLYFY